MLDELVKLIPLNDSWPSIISYFCVISLSITFILTIFPFIIIANLISYFSIKEKKTAYHLNQKINSMFATKKNIFGMETEAS